jgi:hypothetical protein
MEFIPVQNTGLPVTTFNGSSHEDCVKKAVDNGRVRLVTAVDNQGGKPFMATRKSFYYHQHHHRLEKWESVQKAGTQWGSALAAISATSGLKNTCLDTWVRCLQAQGNNIDVCLEQQVNNIERAKKKMFRFRKKKSWLDTKNITLLHNDVVVTDGRVAEQKHIIIGFGDGSFASGGKGER